MEVQQARVFLAVAREGSFSAAARRLYRTQPTITMAVQKLERELGARLFERIGHGVRLTRAGQSLLESVGPLLEQWDRTRSRLQESADGVLRGPVHVGAGEAGILYLLPGPIRSFLRRHPRVEVAIRHRSAEETLALLRQGEIDFALRALPEPPADMAFSPFRNADRLLIAPRGHPIHRARSLTLESLSRHPFILPWPGSATRKLIEGVFAERGLPLKVSLEAGGWETIKRYAGLGLGIGVVPDFSLDHSDRRLAVRSARHLFGQDTYGIVTKRGREPSAATRALIAEIAPHASV
jgi:LysR family transcriptional regulator, putative pyruvate carboxylase regulator